MRMTPAYQKLLDGLVEDLLGYANITPTESQKVKFHEAFEELLDLLCAQTLLSEQDFWEAVASFGKIW